MQAGEKIRVLYSEGSHLFLDRVEPLAQKNDRLAEARTVAELADVVVLCVGLDATIEGEQGDTGNSAAAGDKANLLLPQSQQDLVDAVLETGKPVILVLNAGSAMDLSMYEEKVCAILHCWYSGAQGGRALGEILFGEISPSGKLPVTLNYDGTLPEFTDYSMKGRTYRYIQGNPWKPFGFGLGYSKWQYHNLHINPENRSVQVDIENTGAMEAEEVYQIYLDKQPQEKLDNGKNVNIVGKLDPANQPRYSLVGFGRVQLKPGECQTVTVQLDAHSMETVLESGERVLLSGEYTVYAGGCQPDAYSQKLIESKVQFAPIMID